MATKQFLNQIVQTIELPRNRNLNKKNILGNETCSIVTNYLLHVFIYLHNKMEMLYRSTSYFHWQGVNSR